MATTKLISMHINKGKTIAQCLKKRTDYVKNPEKTEGGSLVTSYACSPETVDQEFLMMRNEYIARTGRTQDNEVIAYQLRQSFKPGEITPEEANRVGYETAMRFLKGEHAFIVATHTDRAHIHNHIVFSSIGLDCEHKFKDVLRSGIAFGKLSDEICKEHQLSVIEKKNYSDASYDKWQGRKAKPNEREKLCMAIDEALKKKPEGFDALMQLLEEAGWQIKRGAQLSFKGPGGKRFLRMETLGEEYTEQNLRAVLDGKRVHHPRRYRGYIGEVGLIIDIQEKIRQGKGKGYERWAEKYNIGAKSKTMVYISTHKIESVEALDEKIRDMLSKQNELQQQIEKIDDRMEELKAFRKAIVDYRKTAEVFEKYKATGFSRQFAADHAVELQARKEAVAAYKANGGTMPKLSEIAAEFETLKEQKQTANNSLYQLRADLHEAQNVRSNVADILGTKFENHEHSVSQRIFPRRKVRA